MSSVPRRGIHRLKSYQIRGSGKTLTNKKLFIKKAAHKEAPVIRPELLLA